MKDTLNIGLFQYDISTDKSENFDIISDQNYDNIDLLILPEMFNSGFMIDKPEMVSESEKESISLEFLKDLSSKNNVAIITSLIIDEQRKTKQGDSYFYFNRLFFIYPSGEYQTYDKRHLFTMGGEDKKFSSGSRRIIVDYQGWKILPLVCYDLRFPLWSRNIYKDDEYLYDVLVYVANWPKERKHIWRNVLATRAIENSAYSIGVNRTGIDHRAIQHSGNSSAFSPKGESLIYADVPKYLKIFKSKDSERDELIKVSLSHKELTDYRMNFNVGKDWDNNRIIYSGI